MATICDSLQFSAYGRRMGYLTWHGEFGRAAVAAEGALREELNHLVLEVAVHRAREADAGLAAENGMRHVNIEDNRD